jgi:hypothetical protein
MAVAIGIVFGATNSGSARQFKMALATSNLAADIRELVAVARAAGPGRDGEAASPRKYINLVNLGALELQGTRIAAPGSPLGPADRDEAGGNPRVEASDCEQRFLERQSEAVASGRSFNIRESVGHAANVS